MNDGNLDDNLFREEETPRLPRYNGRPLLVAALLYLVLNGMFPSFSWLVSGLTLGFISGHSLFWAIRSRGSIGLPNFLVVLSVLWVIQVADGRLIFPFIPSGPDMLLPYGIFVGLTVVFMEAWYRRQRNNSM